MRRDLFVIAVGVIGLWPVLGCSGDPAGAGAPPTFPAAALMSMPSTSGALTLEIRTAPEQPPITGTDAVEYRITGTDGAPAEGLTLDVVPWMPDMGHGASIAPVVTVAGGGRYVISELELFMPGEWELRTTIAGTSDDGATPAFEIP
jgi:YtkA-like